MVRRFRLALKVQSSSVRSDTDRAAELMKDTRNVREARRVLSSDLSTTAAGVTNARRKPASVEPQQPIQRGFSLWALRRSPSSRAMVRNTERWRSVRVSSHLGSFSLHLGSFSLEPWRPPHLACFRLCMDRKENPTQVSVVTGLRDNIRGYSRDPAIFRGISCVTSLMALRMYLAY